MGIETGSRPAYVSVVSGKGGVGKSTVTVNLAVALADKGLRVGVVDADIYGFSIPSLIQLRNEPAYSGELLVPHEKLGVKWMSAGFLRTDNQPVVMRGPMLGRLIRTFLQQVEWGKLQVILFDMPPGTGDIALDLHDLLPECKEILVTTPHDTAAEVAFRAGAMTERTGHELLGIVENMAYLRCPCCDEVMHPFGTEGGEALARALRCSILARLPLERPGADPAAPGVYDPDSVSGRTFRYLAEEVASRILPEHRRASV